MNKNEERIINLKSWKDYFHNIIYLLENGEYLTVYKGLMDMEKTLQKEIKNEEINYSDSKLANELGILKLGVDYSLDFGNKEAFIKATEKYNNFIKDNKIK